MLREFLMVSLPVCGKIVEFFFSSLWGPLGVPWVTLGCPFGRPWVSIGIPLGSLCRLLASLWALLGSLRGPFADSWRLFGLPWNPFSKPSGPFGFPLVPRGISLGLLRHLFDDFPPGRLPGWISSFWDASPGHRLDSSRFPIFNDFR